MRVLERKKRNDWQRHGMHMGKRNVEDGYSLRSGGGWFQVVMVQVEAVGKGQGWNDWPVQSHWSCLRRGGQGGDARIS